jgi:DNA polymerase-3 subunit beta
MNLLAQDKYRGVIMEIEDNNIKVSINNPEMGHGHTDIPLEYFGEKLRIGFNINYLMDFLQALPDEEVYLLINDHTQPCLLKGFEHEDYLCGIMPIG